MVSYDYCHITKTFAIFVYTFYEVENIILFAHVFYHYHRG